MIGKGPTRRIKAYYQARKLTLKELLIIAKVLVSRSGKSNARMIIMGGVAIVAITKHFSWI
ncbi:hypothetical protein ACS0TY_032982 [Phlomoides rotata]